LPTVFKIFLNNSTKVFKYVEITLTRNKSNFYFLLFFISFFTLVLQYYCQTFIWTQETWINTRLEKTSKWRIWQFVLLNKYYQDGKIKDEINWEKRNAYKMLSAKYETKEALEDVGICEWVIMKWILNEWEGTEWIHLAPDRNSVRSCEHGNTPFGILWNELAEQLWIYK
jgi:hypothetical protein